MASAIIIPAICLPPRGPIVDRGHRNDVKSAYFDWRFHSFANCPIVSVLVGRERMGLPVASWKERDSLELSGRSTLKSWVVVHRGEFY